MTRYVSAIGERLLARAGPQPFTYRFKRRRQGRRSTPSPRPAGHIYLYTGMLLKARNVSEVAGVIAHEIGHVARRHVANNFNRALATNILHQVGTAAAEIAVGPEAGRAAHTLGGMAAMGYLNTFSREAEHEADAFAVQLMFAAGYDPRGTDQLLRSHQGGGGGARRRAFLSSHPAPSARVANTRRLIEGLPGGTPSASPTTAESCSEFSASSVKPRAGGGVERSSVRLQVMGTHPRCHRRCRGRRGRLDRCPLPA